MHRSLFLAFAPALLASVAAPAIAQETVPAPQPTQAAQGVISYTPADFAEARPNTALDMISRVPGFSVLSGDQVRGFAGAAGNVLIDGQRPTTKSEGLNDALNRIPISQVERIDIIRGGASGIDMQGQSVIANVIRKKADTFQQVLQAQTFIFAETGHPIPAWLYQATLRTGDHQFDFSLNRGSSYDDSVGFGWRTIYDAVAGTTEFQSTDSEADGAPHNLRANYKGPLFGGTLSLNGILGADEFKSEDHYFNENGDERYLARSANDRGELGLNYKRPMGGGFEVEALALSKISIGQFVATGEALSNNPPEFAVFTSDSEGGESIGRGILRYAPSTALQFEGGGEVAFNYLEQQSLFRQNGLNSTLPASNVRIEELRSEVFLQGTWRASEQLSLEAGVRVEHSELTQTGDTTKSREFDYPKPRVLATWSPTKVDQLRMRVEREVGQLNFEDFASSVDLASNVLSAGNSDLRPDKTWAYELAYERRFWDNGAFVVTLRHEDISDVVDVFPFYVQVDANNDGIADDVNPADGQPDLELVAGPGNIGDGVNDVLGLSLTLPLDPFGLKGAELKSDITLQESKVTDPTTLTERRISRQRPDNINVGYRQDLADLKLTYGINFYAGWREQRYRPTEIQSMDLRTFWGSYLEYKPDPRLTLRAEMNNFNPYRFEIVRNIYDGPRNTGSLARVESERRNSQVIFMLRARYTIG